MSLYSDPPPARTFRQDKPTLLVAWWCTLFAAAIILFRVAGRFVRSERLFREDKLAFACLIPLFIRIAFVHVVLLYGTNNVELDGLSEISLQHRVIGSRLVLASRVSYAATLWMLKFTITEFLKRLTLQIWRHSYELTLRCIRWILLLTFIATLLSDLLECHPFPNYYLVSPVAPTPPQCRQGYAQLLTMATCNVLTDLLLVIFPIPILLNSSMPIQRKLHLVCLFALSLIPVAVTLYGIPRIIDTKGSQQTRSLWASIEVLAATAVANALVLGSFVRDRGVKKQKWKFGSVSESMERSISLRGTVAMAWGSDEDLVRDLGLGVDLELRHHRYVDTMPRLAPMASSITENGGGGIRYPRDLMLTRTLSTMSGKGGQGAQNSSWNLQRDFGDGIHEDGESRKSDDDDLLKRESTTQRNLPAMITPRKVSFFDIGGLLDSDNNTFPPLPLSSATSPTSFPASNNTSISPKRLQRNGSAALLQDLGGLLTPLASPTSQRVMKSPPPSQNCHTPPQRKTRPPLLRGTGSSNWTGSPFSFNSPGRSSSPSREHGDHEDKNGSGVYLFGDTIQMRRLDTGKKPSGELRDVGGLLG